MIFSKDSIFMKTPIFYSTLKLCMHKSFNIDLKSTITVNLKAGMIYKRDVEEEAFLRIYAFQTYGVC